MNKKVVEARLKMAGERARFDGEKALPHVSIEDGVATLGVHFMKNYQTTERMVVHGSIATEAEERKLLDDALAMLKHRAQRPEPRKETLKV